MRRAYIFVWCSVIQGSNAQLTGGRSLAKEGLSAKFELISGFTLASQSSFVSI